MTDTPSQHSTSTPGTPGARAVKVWDLPTRIFHWSLALVVIVALVTQEAEGWALPIHVYSGTLLIGFAVFRLLWGVIGSRHALFGDFVHSFAVVKDYSMRLLKFRPPYVVGHNPLGGWVVVALIALTFFASLTGLMVEDDGYYGPLSHIGNGAFGEAHEGLGSALMTLVIIHIIGVVAHGLISGENLPRAMISGVKHVPDSEQAEDIRPVGIIRPAFATILGVASVWFLL